MKNFNNLTEFKRAIQDGEYLQGGYYPIRHKEWRKLLKRQGNGVHAETVLENGNRESSFFEYPKASQCEFVQTPEGSICYIYQDITEVNGHRETESYIETMLEEGWIKKGDITRRREKVAEYRVK